MFTIVALSACGRYGPPLLPEDLAPQAINNLSVSAETGGVRFAWQSPRNDRRGKELKSLGGYRLYRKELAALDANQRGDEVHPDSPEFEMVVTIQDTHVAELAERREQARAAGLPSRKLKPVKELMEFEYLDTAVDPGKIYVYKLVPYNTAEGGIGNLVRVVFQGTASLITEVQGETLDDLELRELL